MSTFWTRARHVTSSCRCTLCNPSRQTTLPHRSHINTAPARRQARIGDATTTTLFYGTVMGAALYTDASLKMNRRKKLDGDIDQAKCETRDLEESNSQRLQALGIEAADSIDNALAISHLGNTFRSESVLSEATRTLSPVRLRHLERTIEALEAQAKGAVSPSTKVKLFSQIIKLNGARKREAQRLEANDPGQSRGHNAAKQRRREKRMDNEQRRRAVQRTKDQSALRLHLLSPMLSASDEGSESFLQGRSSQELWNDRSVRNFTPYQLKRQEVVMTQLVYRLLKDAADLEGASTVQAQLSSDGVFDGLDVQKNLDQRLEKIDQELRSLTSMRSTKWQATQLPTSSIVKYDNPEQDDLIRLNARLQLSNSLSELFAAQKDTCNLVSNICRILASSEVFPDLHAFNILLINLARLQHQYAARTVWHALRMSGITINETSVSAILKVYSSSNLKDGPRGFHAIASQMDVKHGDGLIPLNEASADLASEFPGSVSDEYYAGGSWMGEGGFDLVRTRYVKVPRNADIYEALITGYLDHGAVDRACEEFNGMLRSGYQPSLDILNSMLLQVLQVKDWELGLTLSRWILDGTITGPASFARDSVYIMAELASIPTDGWSTASGDKALSMAEINKFAKENHLINRPLEATDFEPLTDRDLKTLRTRFTHIRSLAKPVLHLQFLPSITKNFSKDIPDMHFGAAVHQPANLLEYSATKLRHLHEQLMQWHGPISEGAQQSNETIATAKSATKWLVHREKAREYLTQKQQTKIRKTSSRPKPQTAVEEARLADATILSEETRPNDKGSLIEGRWTLDTVEQKVPTQILPSSTLPTKTCLPTVAPKSKSSLVSSDETELQGFSRNHQPRWMTIKSSWTSYA